VATLSFPYLFVAILGGSLEANIGEEVGYSFIAFTFTGVLAQTLFQSTALGLISLIEDRETDFSQEMFVAPISRYAIVFGKIAGETAVSLVQGIALLPLAFLLGVSPSPGQLLGLIPAAVITCLLGGAFGLLILSTIRNQRAGAQIFTFVFLPQFFLAGVFAPIQHLPWYLEILSRISPLRYAVDLTRNAFYVGQPERSDVVLDPLGLNLAVVGAMFTICFVLGTALFVRSERNR